MTIETINLGISFEYDPDQHDGIPSNIFLFQMLNRLGYENNINSIRLKSKQRNFTAQSPLKDCELKNALSVEGDPFKED